MDTGLADRLATSLVVGEGVSWGKAIWDVDWSDGDLLVVGPSSSAPAARLFLGSRASKILRSAPVPVFMAPAPAPAECPPHHPRAQLRGDDAGSEVDVVDLLPDINRCLAPDVSPIGVVAAQRPTRARTKKLRLAGRSASRRTKYGYQAEPYGM